MIAKSGDLWWRQVPQRLARLSPAAAMVFRDGAYIERLPRLAALAPAAAILFGFVAGWRHLLEQDIYTTSSAFMAIALLIGILSAALGAWLIIGYSVGNLVLGARDAAFTGSFASLGKTWVALVLSDIVLVMMVVLIPLAARALARELVARAMPRAGAAATYALGGAVTAAMVYAWSQAAPVLTRPYFTWHGLGVSQGAVDGLAAAAWILPLLALGATPLRGWLETRIGAGREREEPAPVPRRPLPVPVAIGWKVALAVFILAGLMESWIDPVVVALVMIVFLVLREPALRRLPAQLSRVTQFPVLPRLVTGAVISGVLAIIFVSIFGADSVIRPVVLSTLLSLVVFTVLLPEHVLESHAAEHREA